MPLSGVDFSPHSVSSTSARRLHPSRVSRAPTISGCRPISSPLSSNASSYLPGEGTSSTKSWKGKIGEKLKFCVGLGLRLFGGGHLAGIEDAEHLLPPFGRLDRGDGKWQVVEPDAALLGLFRVALRAVGRKECLMAGVHFRGGGRGDGAGHTPADRRGD